MGIYATQVLPRILNVACGTKAVEPLRRRACEGLAGEVVEIGFGSVRARWPVAAPRRRQLRLADALGLALAP